MLVLEYHDQGSNDVYSLQAPHEADDVAAELLLGGSPWHTNTTNNIMQMMHFVDKVFYPTSLNVFLFILGFNAG